MEAVIPATAMALRISEEGERRATRYPVEQTSRGRGRRRCHRTDMSSVRA
jgi:hypothetical protein